jgi:hypothetical protein
MRRLRRSLATAAAALFCAACPGKLDDLSRFALGAGDAASEAGGGGACVDVPNELFVKVCAISGCHSSASKSQGLDLEAPDPGTRLTGACATGGGYLIDPEAPDQSVIYTKLTPSPPFGLRMPYGGAALTPDELACVLTWIQGQKGVRRPCDDSGAPPPLDASRD